MEEEINGLKFQLKREMESYQQLYSSNNEKINALYQKIGELVNENKASQERQAADILVREMRELREENARLAQDNEQLHFEIQGFINEVKRLTNELEECNKYFKATDSVLADSKIPNYEKMKSRIEELEDTIIELQKNGGVNKTIELTELVANLERQLAHESRNLDELRTKLLNYNPKISRDANQQNIIEHLSQTLEEKDARIAYLQSEYDNLKVIIPYIDNSYLKNKERYYESEVHRLRESLTEASQQLEGIVITSFNYLFLEYKLKQSKLEGMLSGPEVNIVGQRPSRYDLIVA
jgi:Chromosome segregation ATPases